MSSIELWVGRHNVVRDNKIKRHNVIRDYKVKYEGVNIYHGIGIISYT